MLERPLFCIAEGVDRNADAVGHRHTMVAILGMLAPEKGLNGPPFDADGLSGTPVELFGCTLPTKRFLSERFQKP